jgi:hypothetical protein
MILGKTPDHFCIKSESSCLGAFHILPVTHGTTRRHCVNMFAASALLANERIDTMNESTIGLDQTEEEILIYEVSDESLEIAASTGQAAYTMFSCTGLGACPA